MSLGRKLDELPTELLRSIFKFCDGISLARLCQACTRFRDILSDMMLWEPACSKSIVDIYSRAFLSRTSRIGSFKDCCRVCHNWKIGKYTEKTYRHHNEDKSRLMPNFLLQPSTIWITCGSILGVFRRTRFGLKYGQPLFCRIIQEDFSRFVVKDGLLVAGGREGNLYVCRADNLSYASLGSHISDVNDVDLHKGIVLSASKDKYVKLWQANDGIGIELIKSILIGDRVLCVAAAGDLWCCGSAGLGDVDPLHIFNFTRSQSIKMQNSFNNRPGAGILDVEWLNPQCILSCGYDAALKLWDVRLASCVKSWDDPHDCSLYCLETDGNFTVMCGTSRHCRVQHWDLRQTKGVQMYFGKSNQSSPVYDLSFDSSSLYMALDRSLNVLDFSTRDGSIRNFDVHA